MKKNIIAMAVAAAVAAPAAAMADTTLYGKVHASYDFWGGDTADNNDYSLSSNSSRIGIKGQEAISDNLSLVYQWESTVDFGGDGSGIGSGPRNTFIGFAGNWGTAIAGRHDTPYKSVGRKYDLFGDTIGDSRSIIRGRAAVGIVNAAIEDFDPTLDTAPNAASDWDLRTNNTVAYVTPNMGGFQATLAYVSDWSNDLNNDNDAYSISAGYEIAGFTIDAAYELHNAGDAVTGPIQASADAAGLDVDISDDSSAYRIGAGYTMGGFKVVGLYQNIDNVAHIDGEDMSAWGLGGAYSFGKSTVKAQYYRADDFADMNDTGADLWAVGYDYKLSKQTNVYAAYGSMAADNNSAGAYVLGAATGHGDSPSVDGEDSNA
ncbi:MAG: porin, partial [Pseudomonadota bacterium]